MSPVLRATQRHLNACLVGDQSSASQGQLCLLDDLNSAGLQFEVSTSRCAHKRGPWMAMMANCESLIGVLACWQRDAGNSPSVLVRQSIIMHKPVQGLLWAQTGLMARSC